MQRQERDAAAVLGEGFTRGRILQQLRGLDKAYSTRSVDDDLVVIAKRIEAGFEDWSNLFGQSLLLREGVTDLGTLRGLLAFFLDDGTKRKPRSLATEALHFATLQSFLPADTHAANLLGCLLGAGSWADTAGLGPEGMAQWFHGYLDTVRRVFAAHGDLMGDLLRLNAETVPDSSRTRLRGRPKVLDKILWWLGRPGQASVNRGLFA